MSALPVHEPRHVVVRLPLPDAAPREDEGHAWLALMNATGLPVEAAEPPRPTQRVLRLVTTD